MYGGGAEQQQLPFLEESEGGVDVEPGLGEVGLDILDEGRRWDSPPLRDTLRRRCRHRRRGRGRRHEHERERERRRGEKAQTDEEEESVPKLGPNEETPGNCLVGSISLLAKFEALCFRTGPYYYSRLVCVW